VQKRHATSRGQSVPHKLGNLTLCRRAALWFPSERQFLIRLTEQIAFYGLKQFSGLFDDTEHMMKATVRSIHVDAVSKAKLM
jgi:hypothetical protein